MKKFLFLFLTVCSITAQSQIVNVQSCLTPQPVPVITNSATSLPAFSTSQGTPSASAFFTTIATNLTQDGLVPVPIGYQLSTDNSTWQSSSLPLPRSGGNFAGQPVSIYCRLSGSASAGTYTTALHVSAPGAVTQDVQITGTVSAGVTKDSIRVQFDSTSGAGQVGMTQMTGSPTYRVLTATGGNNNTITISSVSNNTNNWTGFSLSVYPNNGTVSGTVWNYLPNAMKECWFNYNNAGGNFNQTYPQLKISGLNTASTYNLQLTGSVSSTITGFQCIGDFNVLGSVLGTMQSLNAQPSGVENKGSYLTFTNITPDGTGAIYIYMNPHANNNLAAISALILKEN